MASSEGSAHAQWRRFFDSAGGADIFEIIDAAVAVAALDQPAELKQRRERIAQRLYTGGILSCGDDSDGRPLKGCRSVAASEKEDRPPASFAEKATTPIKSELARKNSTAAAADRNKAPAQPSEQSMEAMLASAKRRLKEGYKECEDAKRQRKTQMVEAPEMARQRQKNQRQIIRRRDQVRCTATIAEGRALMSTPRASWV